MKKVWKVIFKIFLAVMVVVLLTMGIALVISRFREYEYRIVLEYLGVFLIVLGALAAMGGRNIMQGHSYNLSRHVVEDEKFFRNEIYILFESYRFTAFMAISGIIILFISLIIYNLT